MFILRTKIQAQRFLISANSLLIRKSRSWRKARADLSSAV